MAATTDKRQTEAVQTLQILGSYQHELHFQNHCKEQSSELRKDNFIFISSGQVWKFCLSSFVSGSLQLEILVTAYLQSSFFPMTCDRFQGSIPAELDLISSKARTDDHHPKQRVPLWDIRADVIGRRDNRFILQHVTVTSFLVRSFLAQHILLNWDVLLIRILLKAIVLA